MNGELLQSDNNQDLKLCPACRNKIPQDATACGHCGAHEIITYNFLGKLLSKLRFCNYITYAFFAIGILSGLKGCTPHVDRSEMICFLVGLVFYIPQILLWFLPKDKITEKMWIHD